MLVTSSILAVASLGSATGCANVGSVAADAGLRDAAVREVRLTAMRRQALREAIAQRDIDRLMRRLAKTRASIDVMAGSPTMIIEALNIPVSSPDPVAIAPDTTVSRLKRVREQLADVRRELLGQRFRFSPETVLLHELERELLREQRELAAADPAHPAR